MHHFAFIVSKSSLTLSSFYHKVNPSGKWFDVFFQLQHMQTLVQTQKMDQLEQEFHELREEVTTL